MSHLNYRVLKAVNWAQDIIGKEAELPKKVDIPLISVCYANVRGLLERIVNLQYGLGIPELKHSFWIKDLLHVPGLLKKKKKKPTPFSWRLILAEDSRCALSNNTNIYQGLS